MTTKDSIDQVNDRLIKKKVQFVIRILSFILPKSIKMEGIDIILRVKDIGRGMTFVSTNMPIKKEKKDNGFVQITFPLMGELEIFCKEGDDTKKAVIEAISSFLVASDKFGRGVKAELNDLGWVAMRPKFLERHGAKKTKSFKLSSVKPKPEWEMQDITESKAA